MKHRKVSPQQPQSRPATQLILSDPENLRSVMQDVQIGIARRAYELFEARGLQHGHDWEDWFRAESELLRPVPVSFRSQQNRSLCAPMFSVSTRVNSK